MPVSVLRDQRHQTLTGTKKKTTTRCTKPSQAPKKNKKHKSQHLLRILDPPCLPMFCEIVLCCFCFFVPANVFRASLQNKMQKNAPRFQSHQMQKTSVFTMICVHFHAKITSMVPRSQKNGSQLLLFRGVGGPNLYTTCFRVHPQVSFEITDLLSG